MLSHEERRHIYEHAHIPEHLPEYLAAISGAEPHLRDGHLYLSEDTHLTFIGYPLTPTTPGTPEVYETLCRDIGPDTVAIIAPEIWLAPGTYEALPGDQYFALKLPLGVLPQGVGYMVRRGKRELQVMEGTFGREHKKLLKAFLSSHSLGTAQEALYRKIPSFLKRSPSTRLLEARQGDRLIAFNILDLGAAEYGFYLFNFRSTKANIPGASDLLFFEMANMAHEMGKEALNLGLGINAGIRRFKEKWGARPFLPYTSALVQRKPPGLGALANKL